MIFKKNFFSIFLLLFGTLDQVQGLEKIEKTISTQYLNKEEPFWSHILDNASYAIQSANENSKAIRSCEDALS